MLLHRELFRLLNKHVSITQTAAFAVANVLGMLLLIGAVQFYSDIKSLFASDEGIMKPELVVVTKKVSTFSMLRDNAQTFSKKEIAELRRQPFVDSLGAFTPSHFGIKAVAIIPGGARFSSDMFFEAVPDQYVDVKTRKWQWKEGDSEIPVVLPRSYLNLYNFGFAQTKGLPKLSEEAISVLPFSIYIQSPNPFVNAEFNAHIVGFSNRLNTILVPEKFLLWANNQFGDGEEHQPSRLIMKVKNPADAALVQYFNDRKLLAEQDNLEAGRMTWFLSIVIAIVLGIGIVICALAFYLLMLSIFLLVQKNQEKLKTLRLIGYSVAQVAAPYVTLAAVLNVAMLIVSWGVFLYVRSLYIGTLTEIYPEIQGASLIPTFLFSLIAILLLATMNALVISKRIKAIQ